MAYLSSAEHLAHPQSEERRGQVGWIIVIVLFLLALVLFLAFPLETISVQPWVTAWQAQLRLALIQLGPFVLVALLGAVVGFSEIVATFANYPREALRTRWAQFLVLVNLTAAALAFWIARTYAPSADLVMTIIGVGLGFQALIRTRFIIAKEFSGKGSSDISLNLGWLYDQFQNLCKNQIDLELMKGRRTAVTRLLERFPKIGDLKDIAAYTIVSRATLTTDEEKARLAELDTLFNPNAPANFAKTSMALMILENGGQAYVDLLLSESTPTPSKPTPESIAKQLVEKYTLSDLVALATRLLTSENEQNWIKDAAKTAQGAPEASQKGTIALFLIQRAGTETVLREII